MIITSIDICKLNLQFHHPLKVAIGVTEAVENVAVKLPQILELKAGARQALLPLYCGDLQATAYATAQHLARLIVGKNPLAENRMAEINRYSGRTLYTSSL